MSRSWLKAFTPSTMARSWLGIAIGRCAVCVAGMEYAGRGRQRMAWVRHETMPCELFSGAPAPQVSEMLAAALRSAVRPLENKYVRIQITLPDAACHALTLGFDELPAKRQAVAALVRWRMARELNCEPQTLTCAWQLLGEENGRHLVFVTGVDHAWYTSVQTALRLAGIVPEIIDLAASHRFNRYHDTLLAEAGGGALLALDVESYSICLWDALGRLRLVRARWRDTQSADDRKAEWLQLVRETEYTVRAYAQQASDRSVSRLWVSGDVAEAHGVAEIFEQRAGVSCGVLPLDHGLNLKNAGQMSAVPGVEPALAALIPR